MATKAIEAAELKDWLVRGKPVNLLDIRPDDEREEWMIPGSIHYNAYERLKAGDLKAMDALHLDKSHPVVTVCARGRMSRFAADQLSQKGYEAYSLQGGMKDWNFAWDTSVFAGSGMKVIQVRRMAKGCLSYLIGSGDQAMVIDASLDPAVYVELAKEEGWNIAFVADTHIHADYVSRTRDLAEETGARHLLIDMAKVSFPFVPIQNGQEIKLGRIHVKVLHTPGHTWESTSFLIDSEVVFTGDTLFTDGVGRPDLKAEGKETNRKAAALYDSLMFLMQLSGGIQVLPAHISRPVVPGQELISASIDELRKALALLHADKEVFCTSIQKKVLTPPPNYLTISEINKRGDHYGYELAELEAGANRCAVN